MQVSVMVVDDDNGVRELLCRMLEMSGYATMEAVDGVDAWEKIALSRPDVMILDVMMPRMDGFTLCKKLREHSETAELPIILLSGKVITSAAEEEFTHYANLYLRKPVGMRELLAGIQAVKVTS